MKLTPEEAGLKKRLDEYLADKDFGYYPDEETVAATLRGLCAREREKGKPYCTCCFLTGNSEIDDRNVCPCEKLEEQIRRDGHCHCRLFAVKD